MSFRSLVWSWPFLVTTEEEVVAVSGGECFPAEFPHCFFTLEGRNNLGAATANAQEVNWMQQPQRTKDTWRLIWEASGHICRYWGVEIHRKMMAPWAAWGRSDLEGGLRGMLDPNQERARGQEGETGPQYCCCASQPRSSSLRAMWCAQLCGWIRRKRVNSGGSRAFTTGVKESWFPWKIWKRRDSICWLTGKELCLYTPPPRLPKSIGLLLGL